MHPKHVKSPMYRTRNHKQMFMSPEEWEENFSVVEADVLDPNTDTWARSLGIRWDGDRIRSYTTSVGRSLFTLE